MFHWADLLNPTQALAQKISDEIGLHGIIAIALPEAEQLLLQQLRKTNEAVFNLPDETLKAYHFGGSRRTETNIVTADGLTIPKGTRLPLVGFLHSGTPLDEIKWQLTNSTSKTGSQQVGFSSQSTIYERVYAPKLFRGPEYALIPPNTDSRTQDMDFEQIWLKSMRLLEQVNNYVIRALGKANGWSTEILERTLEPSTKEHSTDSFRLVNLPSVAADKLPNTTGDDHLVRFEGHYDRNSKTTALPAASLPGLQVAFSKESVMRDVESPDSTQRLVYVIAGNFLKRLTDGLYQPSFHRVVGTVEQMGQARYSEAYFKGLNADAPWQKFTNPKELLTLPTPDNMPITKGTLFAAYKALPLENPPAFTPEWYDCTYPAAVQYRLEQIAEYKKKLQQ